MSALTVHVRLHVCKLLMAISPCIDASLHNSEKSGPRRSGFRESGSRRMVPKDPVNRPAPCVPPAGSDAAAWRQSQAWCAAL